MQVLITGCTSGIGRALTRAFQERGDTVWATGQRQGELERVAAEDGWTRVELRVLDVTDPAAWERVVGEMESDGRSPEVVCNVAGYLLPARVEATTVRDVDAHIDVNVKGVILGTRRCAQSMLAAGRGHIINIASLAGMSAVPGLSLYSASKFAVRGFSLSVAQELRSHGIAVTVVCPDAVQTPMLELQVDYEESALVFSGTRALSTDDVCAAITGRILRDRPLEVALPGWRGVLARIGGAAPGVAAASEPLLRRVGRLNLERARRARDAR